MSDTAYQIDLPAEVLSGNDAANINPPVQVQHHVPDIHNANSHAPWYEKRLNHHFHKPEYVCVKIGNEYIEASPTERRIIWVIEGLVCSPVILVALLFRGGDR